MPVIVRPMPLATAFHELRQRVASLSPATRRLVQLTAAQSPDERLRAVEQALTASVRLGNRYEPLVTTTQGEWAYDIIAVPGADSAIVLSLPDGGYLWLSSPPRITRIYAITSNPRSKPHDLGQSSLCAQGRK